MAIGSVALSASRSSQQLWRRYNTALQHSPLQTKALTCATAYAIGDVAAQLSSSRCKQLHRKVAALDVVRTSRMAMYGLLWTGCVGHFFYTNLDKVVARRAMKPVAEVASKVGIDQLMFSPVATAMFYVWNNLASNTLANVPEDLSTKLCPTIKASWAMWVPAMTVNMALVPAQVRILFINATAIVWTLILSNMASSGATAEAPIVHGDNAIVPLVPLGGAAGEPVEAYECDEYDVVPQEVGNLGVLCGGGVPQRSMLHDVWQLMRGSEQPRRSSRSEVPPTSQILPLNFNQAPFARMPHVGPSLSRVQSFATGNGEDSAMLDAIVDDVLHESLPPTPGASDNGSTRIVADFGGLPVDPICDCLS